MFKRERERDYDVRFDTMNERHPVEEVDMWRRRGRVEDVEQMKDLIGRKVEVVCRKNEQQWKWWCGWVCGGGGA